MKETNDGKEFEELIEKIYKRITGNSKFEQVERNVALIGKEGKRQIDVLLTTSTAGLKLTTVIECKDHSSKLSVGFIDAFHSKLMDINANKGVMIARSGFSSKAIGKAKRLGISLYTAHEAAHPKWDIDIEIPIVIAEISIREVGPSFVIPPGQNKGRHINYWKDNVMINDKNILSLFQKEWNSGIIKYEPTEEKQDLKLSGISAPFYLRDTNNVKLFIEDFHIFCNLKMNYYLGFLKELDDTQLIKDITSDQIRFFTDASPIIDYKNKFRRIEMAQLPENKLTLTIHSNFQINTISVKDFDKFPKHMIIKNIK